MPRTLGSLAHSLANLFLDHSQAPEPSRHHHNPHDDPEYLLLAQGAGQARPQTHPHAPAPSHGSQAAGSNPTQEEVRNYLGKLAKDYHLPPKLVYAVANAESSVDPNVPPQPNYETRHGKRVLDEHGNPTVKSWDYGLMQINSPRIGHDKVKDADGHPFLIGEEVKHDWKANARAGVAIIKHV